MDYLDHLTNYELKDLSHELSVWAQRVSCQLQTGDFDGRPMLSGSYYLISDKLRKHIDQMKRISQLLRELEVEPGTMFKVREPDDSMIGEGFIRIVKAVYGEDFDFETFMLTYKEGKIVSAFDGKDKEDGAERD